MLMATAITQADLHQINALTVVLVYLTEEVGGDTLDAVTKT